MNQLAFFADANLQDLTTVSTSGDYVVREGIIWRCGDYTKTHGYSQTPEQLADGMARFQGPVSNEYIHLDSEGKEHLLEGEFGMTDGVKIVEDGKALFARVSVPKWFDDIVQRKHDGRLPVSAVWKTKTHDLIRVGFVKRGGVPDAAVFGESEQDELNKARNAYHAAKFGLPEPQEQAPPLSPVDPLSCYSAENPNMKFFTRNLKGDMHVADADAIVAFTKGTVGPDTKDVFVQEEGGSLKAATPSQIVAFTGGKVEFAQSATTELPADIQAKLDRLAKFEEGEKAAVAATIKTKAEAHYQTLLAANKVVPGEKEKVVAAFTVAENFDAKKAELAYFAADDEGAAAFAFVPYLNGLLSNRQPHKLTEEQVAALGKDAVAVFDQQTSTTTDSATGEKTLAEKTQAYFASAKEANAGGSQ